MDVFTQVSEIFEECVGIIEVKINSIEAEEQETSKIEEQASGSNKETVNPPPLIAGDKGNKLGAEKNFLAILQESKRCHVRAELGILDRPRLLSLEAQASDILINNYDHFQRMKSLCSEYDYLIEKGSNFLQTEDKKECSFDKTNTIMTQQMCLPKINIPIFEGDYSKWVSFKNLFTEVFLKEEISSTQRMIALKSYLRGEPLNLIYHLSISNDNFIIAWNMLAERYTDIRQISAKLFKNIVDAPAITFRSAKTLKNLHDTISINLTSLEAMKMSKDEFINSLLHFLIVRKLDATTKSQYDESLNDSTNIPNIEDLIKFLQKKFKSLENPECIASFLKREENSEKKGFSKCILKCDQNHPLNNCEKFKKQTVQMRNKTVIDNKFCNKCLKSGHSARNCIAYVCSKCKKDHNTLLHYEKPVEQKQKVALSTNNERKKHVSRNGAQKGHCGINS